MDKEAPKARRKIIITFAVFAAIFIIAVLGLIRFKYWHSFSTEKWRDYPERRAKMTADLFDDYDLIGLSEEDITELLGPNDNDRGYFIKEDRFVYCLGNERTIMDDEWLLIDFENSVVCGYSITMD